MKLLPSLLGFLLLGTRVGAAQVVRGRVLDAETHAPVAAARVTILGPTDSAGPRVLTDDQGGFVLRPPVPGRYVLEVVRLGYTPQRQGPFAVGPGEHALPEVSLHAIPYQLDSLTITTQARSQFLERVGWFTRQRSDFGRFLTRDQIESHHVSRITDLLTVIPGVRLVPDARSPGRMRVQMRGSQPAVGGSCEPRVFVDGLMAIRGDSKPPRRSGTGKDGDLEDPFGDSKNPEPPLDDIANPEDIEGIEVYRSASQVPVEFGGTGVFTRCGVVVIWTRHGR